MSTKKPRLWHPRPHRAVDWNQKAIEKRLAQGPLQACVKVDGFRVLIRLNCEGDVVFTTREGIEISSLSGLAEHVCRTLFTPDTPMRRVYDGEVWIKGIPFEEMSGLLRRDTRLPDEHLKNVHVLIFDVGLLEDYEGPDEDRVPNVLTLEERRRLIGALGLAPFRPLIEQPTTLLVYEQYWTVYTVGGIQELYQRARAAGYEGLILKDPHLLPRNGKVSGWWKVKPGCGAEFAPGFEADGTVIDYVWGDPDKANANKIVGFRVRLEDGAEVNATGLTQDQMACYTQSYHATAYEVGITQTIYIGRACRVSGMERTKDGSIRHPHFDGFRDIDGAEGLKA
ncbi:putative DNA ligase [Pseudomonas phage LKA1]|uniref:DNA ligase n=1 Tax=Pseudomonas phage LKA1 TaxID=386793 RepID=Q0E5Y7_9CAUD|nr:DNA ligase [Pseudomonas phage LKA1]CAK24995.1 putative DNA ligase [Pseudomonas phage LKA1]